jgi:hypothetical protein
MMRRFLRSVGGLLVVGGVAGFGLCYSVRSSAVAQTDGSYSVRARADSVGVQLIAANAPVVSIGGGEVAFVTPSSTQSLLDSLSGSTSFGSAPYPGDLLVTLPGTAAGLFGSTGFPVPSYPFYVSSSYPTTPAQSDDVGPYSIKARSDADSTGADAHLGLSTDAPQVVSVVSHTSASRDPSSGKVIGEAVTQIAPFSVSQVLRLGEIKARARVEFDPSKPDMAPTRTTSLSIGTITIGGIEVGLTDKGFTVGGKSILPIDLRAVVQLLHNAGLQLEYVPTQQTKNSVTSAAIRLSFVRTFPTAGPTTVRLLLGQASASADAQNSAVVGDTSPPVAGGSVSGSSAADSSAGAGTSGSGGGGLSAGLSTGPSPATPAVAAISKPPAVAGSGPSRTAAPRTAAPALAASATLADLRWLYPVLVLGGCIAVMVSRRSAWQVLQRRLAPGGPGHV